MVRSPLATLGNGTRVPRAHVRMQIGTSALAGGKVSSRPEAARPRDGSGRSRTGKIGQLQTVVRFDEGISDP
jgi:hypothetical protein